MSFLTPRAGGDAQFELTPAGTHAAICYRVIDLGTQESTFGTDVKKARKILISWELPDETMKDGRPFTVHTKYTLSLHKKAKLRADLESWRGRAFTEKELEGFDLEDLLSKACLVNVVHNPSADGSRTYANVKAVTPIPKSMRVPPRPENPVVSFKLAEPDWHVFDNLSESMQEQIKRSPEYAEATQPNVASAPEEEHTEPHDDTPF